ncbi:MAG: hypothetical protein H6832_16605 [Planctomycetes bacterium]|nr:hypothetical protein [Planctomycetota bacterium]MCB9920025.1 hypothetical protein [Planctomycetota bacterium]
MKTRKENCRGLVLGLAAVVACVGSLTWVGDVHAAVSRVETSKILEVATATPKAIQVTQSKAPSVEVMAKLGTTFPSVMQTICSEEQFTKCGDYAVGATCCPDSQVVPTKCSTWDPKQADTPTNCASGYNHTNCPDSDKKWATLCFGKPVPTYCGDTSIPTHCVNGDSPPTKCQGGEEVTWCLSRGTYATECPGDAFSSNSK